MSPPLAASSRLAVLAAAALALGACAGGPPGGPAGPGGPDRPPPPALFVSPFGELFVGAAGEPWPVDDWFLGADADLDGAVTFEEFTADGRRWFDRLDSERDGRLSAPELAAYEAALAGAGQGAAPGGPGPERPRRRARQPRAVIGSYGLVADAGFFNLPQPVKAADVNVDQRVTAEEWSAATGRWFLALDTDRDGRLTLATLPRTPLQARVEARQG